MSRQEFRQESRDVSNRAEQLETAKARVAAADVELAKARAAHKIAAQKEDAAVKARADRETALAEARRSRLAGEEKSPAVEAARAMAERKANAWKKMPSRAERRRAAR